MKKEAILDDYRFIAGAIPPAAALLAMATSFKVADKYYDRKLSKRLDADIKR